MKKRNIIIAVSVLLVLIIAAGLIYQTHRPEAVTGNKTIVVQVVHKDGSEKSFSIRTDAENLRGAMEQENLISGSESTFGLMVETVDGETADMDAQEWWGISKDGEMTPTGVDDTMIADGEHYEFTLNIGW